MAADKMGNSHDEPIGILPVTFLWERRPVQDVGGSKPIAQSLEYLLGSRTVTYNWPCRIGSP